MRSNSSIVGMIEVIKESELAKKQLEDRISELKDKLKAELKARRTNEMHVSGWTVKTVEYDKKHFDSKSFQKDFEKLYEQYCSPKAESRFYILKEGH